MLWVEVQAAGEVYERSDLENWAATHPFQDCERSAGPAPKCFCSDESPLAIIPPE